MALKLGSNLDLDRVVKALGAKYKLVPHLDMAIGEDDFAWRFDYSPKTGDDAWHPSGDCTPSLHALYQKATGRGEPDVVGPGLRKIFMIGHFWHQYLQWVVEHKLGFAPAAAIERKGARLIDRHDLRDTSAIWNEIERGDIKTRPYGWVTGSADIAPCDIPGYGEVLVDFKTVNPRMFAAGMSPDYLAKWECQANVYLDFFGLDRALFVLIDKPGGDMKEIMFEHNPDLVESLYAKWGLVSACLEERIEPPADEPWELPLRGPVTA